MPASQRTTIISTRAKTHIIMTAVDLIDVNVAQLYSIKPDRELWSTPSYMFVDENGHPMGYVEPKVIPLYT